MITTYEAHELALVFPPMIEPEFVALREDIREHGQNEPITLYEGKILDGIHRYRACQELGREPRVVRFEGNPRAAAQLVLGRNFHRRHLTASQRAIVAAEMCKLRPRGNAGNSPYLTVAQASTLMGVGQDLVNDAKRLLRNGDEEVVRSVRDGLLSVSAAIQERKKAGPRFTFLEQFAQRLDRALQGQNDRDAQVAFQSKPLLQFIALRIRSYLEPDATFDPPLRLPDGTVVDFSERKAQSWLYENRGEEIAESRRAWLATILPKVREAAAHSPGKRCAVCGLPLLLDLNTDQWSYCAVCSGDVLWEWWAMREQIERVFSGAPGAGAPPGNGGRTSRAEPPESGRS
ncbi:MAG TPA: ParB N-terminal domain-containing protein [Methylomirabilota bacterium]